MLTVDTQIVVESNYADKCQLEWVCAEELVARSFIVLSTSCFGPKSAFKIRLPEDLDTRRYNRIKSKQLLLIDPY